MTNTEDRWQRINEHYGRADLYDVILEELEKAGIDQLIRQLMIWPGSTNSMGRQGGHSRSPGPGRPAA